MTKRHLTKEIIAAALSGVLTSGILGTPSFAASHPQPVPRSLSTCTLIEESVTPWLEWFHILGHARSADIQRSIGAFWQGSHVRSGWPNYLGALLTHGLALGFSLPDYDHLPFRSFDRMRRQVVTLDYGAADRLSASQRKAAAQSLRQQWFVVTNALIKGQLEIDLDLQSERSLAAWLDEAISSQLAQYRFVRRDGHVEAIAQLDVARGRVEMLAERPQQTPHYESMEMDLLAAALSELLDLTPASVSEFAIAETDLLPDLAKSLKRGTSRSPLRISRREAEYIVRKHRLQIDSWTEEYGDEGAPDRGYSQFGVVLLLLGTGLLGITPLKAHSFPQILTWHSPFHLEFVFKAPPRQLLTPA